MNSRVKRGLFNEQLFEMVEALSASLRSAAVDEVSRWKARCLIAEIRDHRGRTKAAQAALQDAGTLLGTIQTPPRAEDPDALALRREEVRAVVVYARTFFYRERKFKLAREHLLVCRDFVQRHLQRPDFPCYGTLQQLSYGLGCAMRQLGEYDAADEAYGDAISFAFCRAEHYLRRHLGDASRIDEEVAFSRHRTALALGLGLGWTALTRGQLSRALNSNITPAQVILKGGDDPISAAYLSLIRGSILRARAGRGNPKMLADATAAVRAAYDTFTIEPYRHDAYAARAAFELALAAFNADDLAGAKDAIADTERRASMLGDAQWISNVWLVRSRISRHEGDYESAMEHALQAERTAARQEEVLGVLDAQIAQGEALLRSDNVERARDTFHKVLAGVAQMKSPKIEGVLYIKLAETYVAEKNARQARAWFEQWRQISGSVEHRLVHDMAHVVETKLHGLERDFTIRWEDTDLDYKKHHGELRRWLITRATHDDPRKREIAKRIRTSRVTLDAWERDLGLKAK